MGIDANMALALRQVAGRCRFEGVLCTLGVQDFPPEIDASAFYSEIGFSAVETLDVSDYEGAGHVFDLNAPSLPAGLGGRFDAVLNGGTLEHVFHVPNALTSITRLLRPGGHAIHIAPSSGYADHGFYQISPTLLLDYYAAAGFDVCESILCSFALDNPGRWSLRCIRAGDLGSGNVGALDGGAHLYLFVARKTGNAVEAPVPIQRIYADGSRSVSPYWFKPYAAVDGEATDGAIEIMLERGAITHSEGHCYAVMLPALSECADDLARPARSPLVLLEDGVPVGMAHSAHSAVRETGRGTYSHWGNALYFSASDNSDPRESGHSYSVVLPA